MNPIDSLDEILLELIPKDLEARKRLGVGVAITIDVNASKREEAKARLTDLITNARYTELADLNYWIAMNDMSKDCTPKLFVHIAERFAELKPRESRESK